MESKSVESKISPISSKLPPIIIRKDLHSLIGTVKKMQLVTTYEEVLEGLKIYIREKKLYDPVNPLKICCKNDELSSVIGADEFTVFDVKSFLPKMVIPVSKVGKCYAEGTTETVSDALVKRKLDDYFESNQKKLCPESNSSLTESSLILHIPLSSAKNGDSSDSSDSLQGYEAAFVKEACDNVPSTTDSGVVFSQDESIIAIEETYNIEYEVETDLSDDSFSSSSSLSDSEADIAAEVALDAALLTLVCKTDSDIEFFADNSSDEDIEIPESDHWKCSKCSFSNFPTRRYCSRCWEERLEWLPEKYEALKNKRKRRKNASCREEASVSQIVQSSQASSCSEVTTESLSSSQQSSDACCSSATSDSVAKLCIICCAKPAAASIIHGKYAHQISCYKCARTLQKQKKRCPICRRTIDRVVHQITNI